MKQYNPKIIEPKWQKTWQDTGIYEAVDGDATRDKAYYLFEFPYPSGDGLHVGHLRPYTGLDVMVRHKRMQGYNVLFPMGWDAFGLPTENYAIKNKIPPQVATERNVANFKRQVKSMGYSIDWTREINTTDPDYYKWTQWLFLQFYKAGLAYQAEVAINWCPFEKTGLANEEVVNGRHERCGTLVEKKLLKQWMLKITAYADRLIDDLKLVDYPERVAVQQINWIGRSEGAEIDFKVDGQSVAVFTTRPDTLAGATFLVLAPEHPLVDKIVTDKQKKAVDEYRKQVQSETDLVRQEQERPKTGVWTGATTQNPMTGEDMPVWIADYVLMGYGTGAIMAVPAHDERDFEFAQKFDLSVARVIEGGDLPYAGEGTLVNSSQFDGLPSSEAKPKITAWLEEKSLGKKATKYKLRDWVFSRQRYWGEPIPMIHCPKCGVVPVPDDQLPVKLPEVESYEPTETGESPLATVEDWVNVTCPKCGGPAKRETDTMPNWAGSSWYFLRYIDPHNDKAFADPEKLKYWLPVDLYNGGMEHTTLHLLYSRFWHKFLFDQGLVPTPEPYARRRSNDVILGPDGQKMSKSKGNIISPDPIIESQGADTLRLYELFIGPFENTAAWSDERLAGINRFLHKVWNLAQDMIVAPKVAMDSDGDRGAFELEVDRITHKTIKKVGHDIETMSFNTAVSALMEYVNFLASASNRQRLLQGDAYELRQRTLRSLLLMLAPLAPHLAEELWEALGETDSIHLAPWPRYDEALIKDDVVEIAIQVNGKLRGTMLMPADTTEEELQKAAGEVPSVKKYVDGQTVAKTVTVPRKLVNFVLK